MEDMNGESEDKENPLKGDREADGDTLKEKNTRNKDPVLINIENEEKEDANFENGQDSCAEIETGQKGNAETINRRRRAISAESFDPYDTSTTAVVFHPKTQQQLTCLREAAKKILFFQNCEPEQQEVLYNAMFERNVEPGEVIIQEGDDGDNFYVIETGEYQILKGPDQECHLVLKDQGYFGELALLYNCPRNATIKASTEGRLWCLDQKTFRNIVIVGTAHKRAVFEELLKSVQLFECLTDNEMMNLIDALGDVMFDAGEQIIKEGEIAHTMYFIMQGEVSVRVTDKGTGSERTVKTLKRGDYFGELALVLNRSRVASVYALSEGAKCAVLDIYAFERLLGPCVDIMKRNIDDYDAQRLRLGLPSIADGSNEEPETSDTNGPNDVRRASNETVDGKIES